MKNGVVNRTDVVQKVRRGKRMLTQVPIGGPMYLSYLSGRCTRASAGAEDGCEVVRGDERVGFDDVRGR